MALSPIDPRRKTWCTCEKKCKGGAWQLPQTAKYHEKYRLKEMKRIQSSLPRGSTQRTLVLKRKRNSKGARKKTERTVQKRSNGLDAPPPDTTGLLLQCNPFEPPLDAGIDDLDNIHHQDILDVPMNLDDNGNNRAGVIVDGEQVDGSVQPEIEEEGLDDDNGDGGDDDEEPAAEEPNPHYDDCPASPSPPSSSNSVPLEAVRSWGEYDKLRRLTSGEDTQTLPIDQYNRVRNVLATHPTTQVTVYSYHVVKKAIEEQTNIHTGMIRTDRTLKAFKLSHWVLANIDAVIMLSLLQNENIVF